MTFCFLVFMGINPDNSILDELNDNIAVFWVSYVTQSFFEDPFSLFLPNKRCDSKKQKACLKKQNWIKKRRKACLKFTRLWKESNHGICLFFFLDSVSVWSHSQDFQNFSPSFLEFLPKEKEDALSHTVCKDFIWLDSQKNLKKNWPPMGHPFLESGNPVNKNRTKTSFFDLFLSFMSFYQDCVCLTVSVCVNHTHTVGHTLSPLRRDKQSWLIDSST